MYPLKTDAKKILPKFLYYLLSSDAFVQFATIASVRTSIPKLNRTDMSKFAFFLPSLQYQTDYCFKMNGIDSAINKANDTISKSNHLISELIKNFLGGAN
jgi:type I restriction enzyme S subunit